VRPDGIKIADAPKLAAGNALDSGIWQHADGSYFSGFSETVWTGSTTPNVVGTNTCDDWSMESSAVMGAFGTATETEPIWWEEFSSVGCTDSRAVYCLQP